MQKRSYVAAGESVQVDADRDAVRNAGATVTQPSTTCTSSPTYANGGVGGEHSSAKDMPPCGYSGGHLLMVDAALQPANATCLDTKHYESSASDEDDVMSDENISVSDGPWAGAHQTGETPDNSDIFSFESVLEHERQLDDCMRHLEEMEWDDSSSTTSVLEAMEHMIETVNNIPVTLEQGLSEYQLQLQNEIRQEKTQIKRMLKSHFAEVDLARRLYHQLDY